MIGLTGMDLSQRVLPNGLQVFAAESGTAPVVTICVAVKTGGTCETPETNGMAHFYEHMFFKGNAVLPDQTGYNRRTRELGILSNATTSLETVVYYITLDSRLFVQGMEFMANGMLTPLFDPEEMEREREVITDEYLRSASSPWWNLWRAVERTVYPEPWRGNTIGELEVIQSASPETMRYFQEKYHTPDNAALFILGDVDESHALETAARFFGPWEFGGRSDFDSLEKAVHIPADTTVMVAGPEGVGYIYMILEGPSVLSDRRATYSADLWGAYLDLASRRFQRNLVTEGPFSQVHGGYYTQRFSPMITFGGMIGPDRIEEGLGLLELEIEAMGNPDYFDEEGLAMAGELLVRERLLSRESYRDLAVQTLPFWWVQGNGIEYYLTYEDSVSNTGLHHLEDFIAAYVANRPRALFLVTPGGEAP